MQRPTIKPHRIFIALLMSLLIAASVYGRTIREGRAALSLNTNPAETLVADSEAPTEASETVVVEVKVDNLPLVYGVETALSFDPQALQIVDSDAERRGVQALVGDFLQGSNSFVLRHQADNREGRLEYTMSLLNPAEAVSGDGVLMEVPFKVINPDIPATVSLEKMDFGTREGDKVLPRLGEALVLNFDEVSGISIPLMPVLLGIIAALVLAGLVLFLRLRRRRSAV